MAHELDTNDATGEKAMLSVRETPWHREGVVLDEAPDSIDDAMETAGLDWIVEMRPCLFTDEDLGGTRHVDTGHRVVVRTDREKVLGVVGTRYEPLQNTDAFRVLEPLLDEGVATIETAGSLRGGRDVWMLVRYDESKLEFDGLEGVQPYGLVTNSHDGHSPVRLGETPIRVVCANTLRASLRSLSKSVTVRHTTNVAAYTTDAAMEVFGNVVDRYKGIADAFRRLRRTYLDEKLFEKIVLQAAAPIREDAERVWQRTHDRRDAIRDAWTGGTGHEGDGSAWEAYNGLVEVVDHDPLFEARKRSRVENMVGGSIARTKRKVMKDLLAVADKQGVR